MSDILDTLHSQHEMVKKILQKIEEAENSREKEKLFDELEDNLVPHMYGEEKHLYSVLEEQEENKEEALHAVEEHHAVKLFLKELEGMAPSEEHWSAKAAVLKDMIEHHIEDEETEIFKAARESLSEQELKEIGEKFDEVTAKGKKTRLTRVS